MTSVLMTSSAGQNKCRLRTNLADPHIGISMEDFNCSLYRGSFVNPRNLLSRSKRPWTRVCNGYRLAMYASKADVFCSRGSSLFIVRK